MLHVTLKPMPNDGVGAVLTITSTFTDVLRYHALGQVAGGHGFGTTSVCPLIQLAMEQWPDPIVAIIVADFHVNDPSDMGCH